MSEEEIRDLELLVDPHSLGSFSDQKLVNALTNLMTKYDENEMQRSLQTLDRDQDGKISMEEFDYFMNEYGDKLQHFEKKILFQELIQPTDHLDQSHNNVQDAADLLRQMDIDGQNENFIDIVDGDGMEDDEDFEFSAQGGNNEDDEFDQTVGVLQEILLDSNFEQLQKKFCQQNCMHFEATEENKLIYTDIFQRYQEQIEKFIEDKLNQAIEGFSMERFLQQVEERKDEIDEQIMDTLLSCVDFDSFKELMLFSRAHLVATTPKLKSGKASALGLKDSKQLAQPQASTFGSEGSNKLQEHDLKHFEEVIDKLAISGYQKQFHKDEDNDGDERPDLNLFITKI
eukprot:403351486